MKWFKHMTCSGDDEKLSAIMDELGMEGYGFYWRLLEVVAEKLDQNGEPSCQFSAKKWGNFFQFSAKKFLKFAQILAEKRLISVEISENFVKIDIPNLLKYRDNYQKKCEQTSKKPSSDNNNNSIKEEEKEAEEDINCAEQKKFAQAQQKKEKDDALVVAEIPLANGTGFPVTETHVKEFTTAYPGVDVMAQLREIRAWCIANPKRRKTKNGALRFINSWLDKEQNKAGAQHQAQVSALPQGVPRFSNYGQQVKWDQQQQARALLAVGDKYKDNPEDLPPEWR